MSIHELTRKDGEVRSAHAARVNIAWARYKARDLTAREFAAEVAEADKERMDRTGDFIRAYLKPKT